MADIAKLGFEFDGSGIAKAKAGFGEVGRASGSMADKVARDAAKLQRQLETVGSGMRLVGTAITVGITAPTALAVKAFSDFDSAMTQSLAIMGDVSDAMRQDMADAAREMAKESTFAAKEVAESYYFLAAAGLDAEQSIAALPQVVRFAQAGMFDLALATDLATDAQSALGLTSKNAAQNLENLTRITDVLIKANTIANASAIQFSEALTNKAGNAMAQLNIEVEAGVAVLAAWADQGVKGAAAGERFNIVTRDLQRAARDNAAEFERFGVAVFDAQGRFRSMADIVGDLERALGGMSVEQQGATLSMLGFQDRSVQAIRSLLGLSDQIREYEAALMDAGGMTEEVAEKQLQTFSAQMKLMRTAINDVFIEIGSALVPILSDLAILLRERVLPVVSDMVKAFGDLEPETQRMAAGVTLLVAALGPALLAGGAIVSLLGNLAPLLVLAKAGAVSLAGAIGGVGVAFGAAFAAIGALVVEIERGLIPGMESVERSAHYINMAQRAFAALWEVIKAGGSIVGAVFGGLLEMVKASYDAIRALVGGPVAALVQALKGDFKGAVSILKDATGDAFDSIVRGGMAAADTLTGVGRELNGMFSSIGESWTRIRNRLTEQIEEVPLLNAASRGFDRVKKAASGLGRIIADAEGDNVRFAASLVAAAGAGDRAKRVLSEYEAGLQAAAQAAEEAARRQAALQGDVDAFQASLIDQIESLRRQQMELRGGTRALLEYERAQLVAKGATVEQLREIDRLIDELVELERELDGVAEATGGMGDAFKGAANDAKEITKDMAALAEVAGESFNSLAAITDRALGDMRHSFAAFITGEIGSFKDFANQLGGIMQRAATDIVDKWLDSGIQGLMSGDGFGGFKGAGLYAIGGDILGSLIGGSAGAALSGAGQGAAMGAGAGPWGAAIGAAIGGIIGLLGHERPPRYDLAGSGARGPGFMATDPQMFQTALGEIWANFRRMDSEQSQAIITAVRDFDSLVADIVGDEFLGQAMEAVKGFAWESRFEGEDPAKFLEKRFGLILGSFDGFVQGLVRSEGALESQMQMLGDIIALKGVDFGGMEWEQLVLSMNNARMAGESLGDAFQRISGAFEDYAGIVSSAEIELMTAGMTDAQRAMVDIYSQSNAMTAALHAAAKAAGLEAARSEDLAVVHELTAHRMAVLIGQLEERGRSLVESLFGTELSRLMDEISGLRAGGATDDDLAGLLERQAELERQEAERQRVLQGQQLAQIMADMATATGQSFDLVADRLGFDLAELGELLSLSDSELLEMLEGMQIDPMAVADEIGTMTDRLIAELILLPEAFAGALAPIIDPSLGPGDGFDVPPVLPGDDPIFIGIDNGVHRQTEISEQTNEKLDALEDRIAEMTEQNRVLAEEQMRLMTEIGADQAGRLSELVTIEGRKARQPQARDRIKT